jgi:sulfur-oxidizing protein SoxX
MLPSWSVLRHRLSFCALAAALLLQLSPATARSEQNALPEPMGDPERGQRIVLSRQQGLCLLCHTAPVGDPRFQGNLAPNLAGAGTRWSASQLRQRIAHARSINPDSIMPSYAQTGDLSQVGAAWVGQPLLNPQQIEDVVAYLQTLRH